MFSSKDLFFTPAAGGYTVSKSLRFRSSATAYLNRTFGTPTNGQKGTISFWLKLGKLTTDQEFMGAGTSGYDQFQITSDQIRLVFNAGTNANLKTTAVFRDPSSWYHVVLSVDTTDATAANRALIYVNNVSQALTTTTSVTLNHSPKLFANVIHYIGCYAGGTSTNNLDGYLAEFNFIDGQALTPSSFGAYDTNGIWQPAAYTGNYGNNGFYLKFTDVGATSGSNTGYGKDFAGTNYWTTNNFGTTSTATTYDSMLDSPTNAAGDIGNYCVLNSASIGADATLTEANLTIAYGSSATRNCTMGTIGMSSGKWYWEITVTASSTSPTNAAFGITTSPSAPSVANYPGFNSISWGYYGADGNKYTNGTGSAYGYTFTTNDVIGVAFDADNGKLYFSKNNTWQNSGDPAAGTNAAYTSLTSGPYFPAIGDGAATATYTGAVNFGQRPFTYTPPSGFSALNTQNLSTPTITNGAQYMAAVTYAGDSTYPRTITNGSNNNAGTTFQPDLVWVKSRSAAYSNILYDVVRGTGTGASLTSDTTQAEGANSLNANLTAFTASGFTIGSTSSTNVLNISGQTFVGWQWKAGGTGVTNTSGSITSTVSANTSAGFSVVTFTCPASGNFTVGHGLGVAPSMIIVKSRSTAGNNWCVVHSGMTNMAAYFMQLNTTIAQTNNTSIWANTAPTSTVFSMGTNVACSPSDTAVAYCFAPVQSFSNAFSFTGNGSTDGVFIYLGFLPRMILLKRTDTTGNWYLWDTARNTYNAFGNELYPNLSNAEASATDLDVLSNGFKLRNSTAGFNASGGTYIGFAWASNPFKYSRGF